MGEPEPEVECAQVNVFEESIIQYSGLNLVKRAVGRRERYFFVTQDPMTTYTVSTEINLGGIEDSRSRINMQVHVDNNNNITLPKGRILSPNHVRRDKDVMELLLRNVFNWISEFNSTSGYPETFMYLQNSQRAFLSHSMYQHFSSDVPRIQMRMYDELTGFFNMVMCYRLSTVILLYNMLPFEWIEGSYNDPMLKFWFDEFKEIKIVLNHLTRIMEGLLLPQSYIERYAIGGINKINEDLERVKRSDFYNGFFSTIFDITGFTRNDLTTLYRGMEQQRAQQGVTPPPVTPSYTQQGVTGGAVSAMTSRDNLSMPSRYQCKSRSRSRSTKKTESFIMRKILNYITERTGENREELEEIFSEKNMNPELLEIVGKFLFNLLEVKKQGGSSLLGPTALSFATGIVAAGMGAGDMTTPIILFSGVFFSLWGTATYEIKKRIAMKILVKQKRCYTIYCVMRIQAQNIYDFSCTYNYFGFQPSEILHRDAGQLKTVAFLGRNSYTILFQLVHYFLDEGNKDKEWNIPLILATTAKPNFNWGKEFALEFITDRNNSDVKVIPFMDSRVPIKKPDEFEIIYISPESQILLPPGVTFEQVKGWARDVIIGNGGFENDDIENQRLRLSTFGKKFFTLRPDIGIVRANQSTSKYTLSLNLIRTKNFDEYNKDMNNSEIQHSRVKNVLLNCVRTIQDDPNMTEDEWGRRIDIDTTPLPITETFLDYIKNIFESNNEFITGAKKKRRKTKRDKTRRGQTKRGQTRKKNKKSKGRKKRSFRRKKK